MKHKAILVSLIALFTLAFAMSMVVASDLQNVIDIEKVKVNDVVLSNLLGDTYIGQVSDTVPVFVQFGAMEDVEENIKITVYIDDYKIDIEDSEVLRTSLRAGVSGYTARLSLKLPSSLDLKNKLSEDTRLYVRFKAHGYDAYEESYTIKMSKDFESLNFLSVEAPSNVIAGQTVALDVVLENNGYDRLDDVYVKVSIPELGLSKKVYFGDLEADRDNTYDHIRDTVNRKLYLTLPRTIVSGSYDIEIEAYNYDTIETVTKTIVVRDVEAGVFPSDVSRTIEAGEETIYSVVLHNYEDRNVVYSITSGPVEGLIVDITESIVTVPANLDRTVNVKVKATDSVEEGTYLITLNVNSESGLVKQVDLNLNVEEKDSKSSRPDSVVVWTIVLVIVFVVLLIILIVLLTKKPEEPEEFSETSETNYY